MLVKVHLKFTKSGEFAFHKFIGDSSPSSNPERGIDGVVSCAKAVALEISKGEDFWVLDKVETLDDGTHLI